MVLTEACHGHPRPPTFSFYPIIFIASYKELRISRNPPIFPINSSYSDICILQCEAILL